MVMRKRSFTQKRPTREVFLVFCEGETEREYVEMLKRHYRLPIQIKTKVTKQDICQRFVSQCVNELRLANVDKFRLFYILDADVESTVNKLMRLDGMLILSNPCIELWFLLHVNAHYREIDASRVISALKSSNSIWEKYEKGHLSKDQEKCLIENKGMAAERGKGMQWYDNPSTNMYQLLETLESVE